MGSLFVHLSSLLENIQSQIFFFFNWYFSLVSGNPLKCFGAGSFKPVEYHTLYVTAYNYFLQEIPFTLVMEGPLPVVPLKFILKFPFMFGRALFLKTCIHKQNARDSSQCKMKG